METLYSYKEKMATLQAQINEDATWIAEKAAKPETPMTEIDEKKAHRDDLQKRFDLLKEQHDALEDKQKTHVMEQAKRMETVENDPAKALAKAKGLFYKAAITGGDVKGILKEYQGLGAIPTQDADLGYGDNLLPTNLSNELLTEPFETNSLRQIEPVSNITGLEEAKLDFSIEDADLADVTDKDTAHEIEAEGNLIQYGRYKTKLSVTVKDTVLHGSPFNLASTIDNGLRSALAIKEKMRAFDTAPDTAHAHMSFYSTVNAIKVVPGATLLDAILAAWGDLPDAFAESATVVMRRIDWANIMRDLLNTSDTFYGKKPEDIIGIPVVFNDRASKPVVGDFRYSKQNYDIGTIYETDKDAKKGEYYFVMTAWGDHQIRLKSAFRIAKKTITP